MSVLHSYPEQARSVFSSKLLSSIIVEGRMNPCKVHKTILLMFCFRPFSKQNKTQNQIKHCPKPRGPRLFYFSISHSILQMIDTDQARRLLDHDDHVGKWLNTFLLVFSSLSLLIVQFKTNTKSEPVCSQFDRSLRWYHALLLSSDSDCQFCWNISAYAD